MCPTLTRLGRSSWLGSAREKGEEEVTRVQEEEEEATRARKGLKEPRVVRKVKGGTPNPCHSSLNL